MFDITKEDILSIITGEKIITGDKVRVIFRVDTERLNMSRPHLEKYMKFLIGKVKEFFPDYETLVISKEVEIELKEIKNER